MIAFTRIYRTDTTPQVLRRPNPDGPSPLPVATVTVDPTPPPDTSNAFSVILESVLRAVVLQPSGVEDCVSRAGNVGAIATGLFDQPHRWVHL